MEQKRHPGGLYLLFTTEAAERFSYYGMQAILVLYLVAAFFGKAGEPEAAQWYGSFTGVLYLTPLIGGYIAGKFLGNRRSIVLGGIIIAVGQFLMFASACTVHQSIFSEGGVVNTSVDNSLSFALTLLGLLFIVVGNGFFKPSISTMVGDLYPKGDERTDSAYTIFYSGINVGSLLAPLICGYLTRNAGWADPSAYKWAFLCAGIAVVIAVLIFMIGKDRLLVGPDGKPVGLASVSKVEDASEKAPRKGKLFRILCFALGGGLLFALFAHRAKSVNDYISAAIFSASIVLPLMLISDPELTRSEKMRIGVVYIIAVFNMVFWAAYEQTGSSLTLICDQQCDRRIGSWTVPTAWFQSVNPFFIVFLAPVMTSIWKGLSRRGKEPSTPAKQGWGLILLSLGFVVIACGAKQLGEGELLSLWWLIGLYFIHSLAELCLSPIGLSMVNKLAPAKFATLLMGAWLMSFSVSYVLAGKLAALLPNPARAPQMLLGFEIATLSDFFIVFAVMGSVAGMFLFSLCRLLNQMADFEDKQVGA